MAFLKHVGRVIKNRRKCIVAYRVIPGDPENCLIVPTENLMAEEHDAVIQLVESNTGQTAYELGEAMARTSLPDGSIMLARFHTQGRLVKMPTSAIEMTPTTTDSIRLDELNKQMAEQKGVTVAELALSDANAKQAEPVETPADTFVDEVVEVKDEAPLSDEDLASQYRSDADRLFKEAKKLREMAEELVPTKKTK